VLEERVQEYKNLEHYYSKKLQRTKDEGKTQIDQFKQRVQQIQQKPPVCALDPPKAVEQTPVLVAEKPEDTKQSSVSLTTQSWND